MTKVLSLGLSMGEQPQMNDHRLIPEHELEFSFSRSSGPGGQNVNKVESKVTMKWHVMSSRAVDEGLKQRFSSRFANQINQEGELVIQSDRFREQAKNKDDCMEKLEAMVAAVLHPPKKRRPTKPSKKAKEERLTEKKRQAEKKSFRKPIKLDDE